ncbi:PREDICTED: UPF0454 protein C12orf49 homolog [Priapulus caudatus]|uniref:SREBP regulating gene protein n=1 Tax=Priapulus caudatus TaxID=37621 RepID=A0ABM1EHL6_PRICU|nr:PREDICTED: UPF0454 protein C12orf49 homolog [Priapulus caudatus]
MFSFKTFRKRWVLLLILALSFIYCITSLYSQSRSMVIQDVDIRRSRTPKSFQWQPKFDEANSTQLKTCRNSVQGKALIADERGYVCTRVDIQPGGCCNVYSPNTKHYACDTCLKNGCCAIYEYCISCCLDPEKRPLLETVLDKAAAANNLLYSSVSDHFELCLAKCRTSSQSVQHENSYRDPKAKHCYSDHLSNSASR